MRRPGRRWIVGTLIAVAVVPLVAWLRRPDAALATAAQVVQPKRRDRFAISVTTSGELRSRKFVQIVGPNSQNAQVFQTTISWLVPEGTVVQEGDRVAELDPAPAATRLQTVKLDLQKAEAEFTTLSLDSALTLAQSREDVRTADYLVEEKRIARVQAQFEAPTLKRQADIDYERAVRAAEQAKRTLDVKTQQAVAKLSISAANMGRQKQNLQIVEETIQQFTVLAPSSGMVVYLREYNGQRKGVGSRYYAWDPTVATLPDLTQMQSQTYVNEVDVKKIEIGQPVRLSLDADPAKRLNGRVISVANVGEQRLGQDQKVFEVVVDITNADTTLRPSMTTANSIEVESVSNVLTIPLRAVTVDSGASFVYKKDGGAIVKQMVETGQTDNVDIVVRRGVTADDHLLLSLRPGEKAARTVRLPR